MFSISTWNTAAKDTLSANSRKSPSPASFPFPLLPPTWGFIGRLGPVWMYFLTTPESPFVDHTADIFGLGPESSRGMTS